MSVYGVDWIKLFEYVGELELMRKNISLPLLYVVSLYTFSTYTTETLSRHYRLSFIRLEREGV